MTKEDLMKDIDKVAERKKPIEKVKPTSPVKNKSKPKPKTKEVIKIEKDAVNIAPKKELEIIKPVQEKIPVIEYEIQKTTKFDLNWFYFKKLFFKFINWLFSPYTKEFWEKRGWKSKPKVVNNTPIAINPPKNKINVSQFPKAISTIGDFDKPLTPEEIYKLRRIRDILKNEADLTDIIFRSDK